MIVDPELDYVSATNEGEAVAIAAGAGHGGQAGVRDDAELGARQRGESAHVALRLRHAGGAAGRRTAGQPGVPDEPQHELMGQITEMLSELCGLRTHVFEPDAFAARRSTAPRSATAALRVRRAQGHVEGGRSSAKQTIKVRAARTPGKSGTLHADAARASRR